MLRVHPGHGAMPNGYILYLGYGSMMARCVCTLVTEIHTKSGLLGANLLLVTPTICLCHILCRVGKERDAGKDHVNMNHRSGFGERIVYLHSHLASQG